MPGCGVDTRGRVALAGREAERSAPDLSRDQTKMNLFNRTTHRVRSRDRKRTVDLNLERFEDRCLLSTFTVTNNQDGGPGSLRQAIEDANQNSGVDTIAFNIAVGSIAEKSGLTSPASPEGITSGPDNALWF